MNINGKDIIAVCDTEARYSGRLAEYISARAGSNYEVRLYSSFNLMTEVLGGKRIFTAIIDEMSFNNTDDSPIEADRIITLCRNQNGNGLYKYQSADIIYNSIFDERNYSIFREISDKGGRKRHEVALVDSEQIRDYKKIVKKQVQDKLLVRGSLSDDETLKVIDETIDEISQGTLESRLPCEDRSQLRNQVFYAIRGLDVLEELISDESITEIMVNGEDNIFYEKNGRLINSGKRFDSREMLLDIIRKIVADANRTVNMSNPIVDARLKDGSRINAVLEPVSLDGPILTIRRFPKDPLSADKLISMGAVSAEIMELLRKLVYAGYNILVSGSTGSGKTTFLNILSGFIPKDERIITIEDSAELKIMGIENLVRLESRNANLDGCLEITIRDLIKSALRMRPDRIIVGEVRGAEAVDMLQSFLVGQDGSMSTIHANSAEDALYRLEMLMMINSADIPLNALRRQIATGVDIIVQLGRLKDKSRKLLEIREVTGYEDGEIQTGLLYKYEEGRFVKHEDIKMTYKLEKSGCKSSRE